MSSKIDFVNHHVHSYFSALDGMPSTEDICERIVELGQKSFSITDHGTMSGIPSAYRIAKKAGIGFTPGIEMYFTKDRKIRSKDRLGEKYYHLILLAHNNQGYKNLSAMQTPAWEEGYYHKPRVDYEILDKYHEGLTVTTACLGGLVNQLLLRDNMKEAEKELGTLIDIFGKENVYVEIQRHDLPEQERILGKQVELAKKTGLELLATCDSHYCCPDDSDYHDSLLCTSTKAQKHETKRFKFETSNFYLHSAQEMSELFPEKDFPRALSNTVELAEKTEFSMKIDDDKEYIMPKIDTKKGLTEAETLREHVIKGASEAKRYGDTEGNIPEHVMERIDYELGIIDNMNFNGYFLIVENLVKLFAKNGIYVGPGRGCLAPETLVYTNKGLTPIKNMNIGDSIISETGKVRKINNVLTHKTEKGEKLISLTNELGKNIQLTEKHRVLTSDVHGEKQWKKAKDILVGDIIVYSSNNNEPDYFTLGNNKQLKDTQWGYLIGASLTAKVKDNHLYWNIDNNQLFGETLLSILDDKNIKYTYVKDNSILESITIVDEDFVNYIIRNKNNRFIGLGNVNFTKGFIQSLRSCKDNVPCLYEIELDNRDALQALQVAADSVGIHATIKDNVITLDKTMGVGAEQRFMVTVKDVVEAPKEVYDISVDGEPSFLTPFGTIHNSAPGSVVVYCLGITNLDPFAHTLFFERFLNPYRVSMPDIDIDVPQTKRQQALKLIEEEYGEGHVAHLSNYTMMAMRESLQRMGKVFGLDPSNSNKFTKAVAEYCEGNGVNLKDLAQQNIPQEIKEKVQINDNVAHKIITTSSKLEGTLISYGVHASGIVITSTPVDENFPIRISKKAPLPICQYDGKDVEALGGVKFDMLGLINLDQCEETERNISIDLGEKVDTSDLPLDDPEVYEVLSTGETGGVFQLGCLSGDTLIDGVKIEDYYLRRNSTTKATQIRSVFLGEGEVKPNKVNNVVFSGEKELYELWTSRGETIKATRDHKFFTQRGWVKLKDLEIYQDSVLTVSDQVGYNNSAGTIRGREDIISIIEKTNSQLKKIGSPSPITVGNSTVYPTFVNKYKDNEFLIVVPDHGYKSTLKSSEIINTSDSNIYSEVISYSQVVESMYNYYNGLNEEDLPLGLPLYTQWEEVQEITFYGIDKTYDIMMESPVHNFIANNIMVHNSTGIQSLTRNMKPDVFSDIPALIALYRPGPMGMDTHNEYCRRKNDGADMTVDHPEMEEILSGSYNLTVFQEDLMALSKHFAHYNGAEADDLRKAVAKKNPQKMEEQKRKFIPAVNENYSNHLGEKLWDIIEPFGAYAFCKAHSAAYAITTYRTAWLKTHYPAQFSGAVLDHVLNNPDKLISTIAWIRSSNITINPPDINKSDLRTITTKDSITLPLDIIKNLGSNKAEDIIDERKKNGKYKSVVDFVSRNTVPRRMIIALAKAGAFDSLGANRAAVVANVDTIMSVSKTQASRNQLSSGLFGDLFKENDISDSEIVDVSNAPSDYVEDGKYYLVDADLYGKWERESLGILLGEHPYHTFKQLKKAQPYIRKYPPIDKFTKEAEKTQFSGVIMNIVNRTSNKGNEYVTFNLETDIASVPSIAFNRIPEELEGSVVCVEGKIEDDAEGNGDFIPKAICFGMKKLQVDRMKESE